VAFYTLAMSSAAETVVLVAAGVILVLAIVMATTVRSLRRDLGRLEAAVGELTRRAMPLVTDAQRVVDQAATEMERVGSVLGSTEAVAHTVEGASRLAYRAFANPVVKLLAVRAGAAGGLRSLRYGEGAASQPAGRTVAPSPGAGRPRKR